LKKDYNRVAHFPQSSLYEQHAFLVRLWRNGPEEPWRASVKSVTHEQEIHFSSPENLFLFLHGQIAEQTAEEVTAGS
jgi:hypothetical protein